MTETETAEDIPVEEIHDTMLLQMAIDVTLDPEDGKPISARKFARTHLHCNERTVRKWLAGDNKLPGLAREKCEAMVRAARGVRKEGDPGQQPTESSR